MHYGNLARGMTRTVARTQDAVHWDYLRVMGCAFRDLDDCIVLYAVDIRARVLYLLVKGIAR